MLQFEGLDQPGIWPGGASGVSIGAGYDLGFEKDFHKDWSGLLPAETMSRLSAVCGLRGEKARQAAKTLKDIRIGRTEARIVFEKCTLPQEEEKTMKVFPGSETLPPDAFGALVSLIFNRGSLINKSDRRREMLALYNYFRASPGPYDCGKVADLVESQARLWPDVKSSDGDLHDRRIAEAALIRSCA